MTDVRELEDLLYLVRCAVHTRKPDLSRVQNMNLEALYRFSRFHSLAALTYTALESAWDGHPPQDSLPEGWKEARDAAIRNSLLFTAERTALEAYCEEKGIWYLPLKGILLQKEYPGLGLREMADNDILYDAGFQRQIHDWFVERHYEVVEYQQGVHDTYHKAPIYNFEMHTALFRASQYPEWAGLFSRCRGTAAADSGDSMGTPIYGGGFLPLYVGAHVQAFCDERYGSSLFVGCFFVPPRPREGTESGNFAEGTGAAAFRGLRPADLCFGGADVWLRSGAAPGGRRQTGVLFGLRGAWDNVQPSESSTEEAGGKKSSGHGQDQDAVQFAAASSESSFHGTMAPP